MNFRFDGRVAFAGTGGQPFDPGRPVVLFLHGAGMDHTVWAVQARYFAHHGRSVLAADLPGHGRSAGPPLPSIEAMAAWALRLLDAAGAGRAALVGHSMGALVALAAAAAAPERVASLALLGVAARLAVHPDLLAAAEAGRHLASELVTSWGFGRGGHFGANPAPGLWMMGGALRLLEGAGPGVLAGDLAACAAYDGGLAAARVACPTLLLLGAEDRMTPPQAARPLAQAIAQARTVVLADTGHMLMLERPDAVIDALKDAI